MSTRKRMSKNDVAQSASEYRSKYYKDDVATSVWLTDMVNDLKGNINYVDEDREIAGCVKATADTFEIELPRDVSETRNNFTISHELGHVLLHHEDNTEAEYHRNDGASEDPQEWEANWFAAELLMPEDDFREAAKQLKNNDASLGRRFGVSGAAAKVRLSSLGVKKS